MVGPHRTHRSKDFTEMVPLANGTTKEFKVTHPGTLVKQNVFA